MYYEGEISKLILKENITQIVVKESVFLKMFRFNVDENWKNEVRN